MRVTDIRSVASSRKTRPLHRPVQVRHAGYTDPGHRITRAAGELAILIRSGTTREIADRTRGGCQHQFGGNATRAQRSVDDVDFSTDLMRLAAGGGSAPVGV